MLSVNSKNKGADQLCNPLCSYCTADQRLCFRIGKNPVFSRCGSIHPVNSIDFEPQHEKTGLQGF